MSSRFASTVALALATFNFLGLAVASTALAAPEHEGETSQEKASDELRGNMRVMTAAGPDAASIAAILRKAGVTNHIGFVLPSEEGRDTSVSVLNLECSATPVPAMNGMTFGCSFMRAGGERALSLEGREAAQLFMVLKQAGVLSGMDSASHSSSFIVHALTCADQPVITEDGEKQAFVCKFYTHLQ